MTAKNSGIGKKGREQQFDGKREGLVLEREGEDLTSTRGTVSFW